MRRTAAERTRDGRASPAQQRRVVSEPGKVGEEGRGQAAVEQGRAAGQRVRERLPGRCWSISAAAGRAPCLAGCSQRAPRSGSREGPWGDPGSPIAPQRPRDCGGPGGHQGAGAARRTMAARPRREAGRAGERGPARAGKRARAGAAAQAGARGAGPGGRGGSAGRQAEAGGGSRGGSRRRRRRPSGVSSRERSPMWSRLPGGRSPQVNPGASGAARPDFRRRGPRLSAGREPAGPSPRGLAPAPPSAALGEGSGRGGGVCRAGRTGVLRGGAGRGGGARREGAGRGAARGRAAAGGLPCRGVGASVGGRGYFCRMGKWRRRNSPEWGREVGPRGQNIAYDRQVPPSLLRTSTATARLKGVVGGSDLAGAWGVG